MFWADKIAKEIVKSGKHKAYWVDDMKTPSGRIHVGSLRGVIIHDLIFKALLDVSPKVKFSYVIQEYDPMDGIAPELEALGYQKYMGFPLCNIPSPKEGFKSLGHYYASEFIQVFESLGAKPKIIWESALIRSGKMNDVIRECLDGAAEIRKIYKEVSGSDKGNDWYPFQVICESCGKIGTTKVYDWDGEKVSYRCEEALVTWAQGCGHEGKMSPFNGAGKLPWKVDWPALWKVIGITIETAGKDHMSKGGSHDIADAICKRVLNYPTPFGFSYEFFVIGGKKMSSSKGLGSTAKEVSEIMPPELLRFLMIRPSYKKAIDFDPGGNTIPNLFDDYDFCARQFFKKGRDSSFGRVYELSQVKPPPKKEPFLPRFREVANYIQLPSVNIYFKRSENHGFKAVDETSINSSRETRTERNREPRVLPMGLYKKFEEIKGEELSKEEKAILEERIKYAKIWLDGYAPKELVYQVTEKVPEKVSDLSSQQKDYLKGLAELLKQKDWQPKELEFELYQLAKKLNISTKNAFQAIYLSLIGKTFGPKAAWFLLEQDKKFLIERFKEAQSVSVKKEKKKHLYSFSERQDLFTIDPAFKEKFPSVTVGLAIIKGVNIKKEDKRLIKEITTFLQSVESLTTREIGEYPEIKSYRRIYKETGIDWHSRRPSPEALLRRITLDKGLYTINTCVDAYNLVVMKYRVSAGAFDFDKIKFPTILRFAKKGEKILLLGKKEPTEYKKGEVAYFDQIGGYNIDFNYLDSQRTAATEKTKNLWINVEGMYDITREQVERTLRETISIITKYCEGSVKLAGIVRG